MLLLKHIPYAYIIYSIHAKLVYKCCTFVQDDERRRRWTMRMTMWNLNKRQTRRYNVVEPVSEFLLRTHLRLVHLPVTTEYYCKCILTIHVNIVVGVRCKILLYILQQILSFLRTFHVYCVLCIRRFNSIPHSSYWEFIHESFRTVRESTLCRIELKGK